MKSIEAYYNKINILLREQASKKKPSKKAAKGLLAPSGQKPVEGKKKKEDIEIIADYVQGIRDAKQEMLNGK